MFSRSAMPELIKCVKCPEKGDYYGVDPKRAIYCKECFLKMVHRKFSYCLGKRHIFKEATAESALLVNTGDETSALLISLIRDGLATEQTSKRLRIEPLVICFVLLSKKRFIFSRCFIYLRRTICL